MIPPASYVKTDEQLDTVLHEAAEWTDIGRDGETVCRVPTLRLALDGAANRAVAALVRSPPDNLVVPPEQVTRLRKIVAGREVVPIRDGTT